MIAQYFLLFRWQVLRSLQRHPLLAVLNIATVALGVALYLAIQIANQSANQAFEASVDVVAGKAQLEVNAPAGNLPDALLPKIAALPGVSAATPIVRGFVTLPQFPGEYLDLLGIDVFTNGPFRTFQLTDFGGGAFDPQPWLRGPRVVALSEVFAQRHGLKAGNEIIAQINGKTVRLTIGFLLQSGESTVAPDEHFAAMDIGWAQELLGRSGSLDSVSLRLTKSADPEKVSQELRAIVPSEASVAAPAQRGAEVTRMLAGFQLNLAAMSLVSLLVGMFLIYNTIEASVVRRRTEIGILRSLGATRNEVRWLFLAEAAALGLVGIAVGLVGGYFLARVFLSARSRKRFRRSTYWSTCRLSRSRPWVWISAFPSRPSSRFCSRPGSRRKARPRPIRYRHCTADSGLEESVRLSRALDFWRGAFRLLLAVVFSSLALRTGPAWLGFGAAFFVLAGFSLLAPELISRFARAWKWRAVEPRLAAQNLGRSLLRNSITIASLAAAVAMTVGVAVMVFSFRQTVGSWIEQTLIADLFIGPAANEIAGPHSFMPPETLQFLEKNPAVETIDTFRALELSYREQPISVAVVRGSDRRNLRFISGRSDQIMRRFYNEQCVLASESFARRFHVAAGDVLELPTPSGRRSFPIAGVFYNYTNDQGLVFLSEKNFHSLWHDDRVNSVAVYLKPDASAEGVAKDFRERFSGHGEFSIYSNRSLRQRIFEIFDQTFAVTYVLRTIAVIVAVVGIFLGLTTLVAERAQEFGVLRAIGGSAAQVQRLLLWESGMIGLLASLLGMAAGLCLAVVLTGVINRAFFGWTIQLAFPWVSLAWTPLWIVAAASDRGLDPGLARGSVERRGGIAQRMKKTLLPCFLALACVAADWRIAAPGLRYEFPRDHHVHENFKTEWWYFTGNLSTASGGRYGYELTFFRQGIRPPEERGATTSRFVVGDLKFAHFTVTDPAGRKFLFDQKTSRGSFGEAGFGAGERLAWIDGWELETAAGRRVRSRRADDRREAEIASRPAESADDPRRQRDQRESHRPGSRLLLLFYHPARDDRRAAARGSSASRRRATAGSTTNGPPTNSLPGQAGWNWVSAQFDDGSELMLYQMRLTNGTVDAVSSGTFVRADGSSISLTSADFQMSPTAFWKSSATGANYPISWKVAVPQEHLAFTIAPMLSNQELVLAPIVYWEGAFDIEGSHAGHRIGGQGYLELTGYAAPLTELNR